MMQLMGLFSIRKETKEKGATKSNGERHCGS
ncbi:MAG: hypothetical protein JWM14_3357 [Chitinophagaceae bacterium]|nr:hypothetical protein [Chitinophagaceae bacterium]